MTSADEFYLSPEWRALRSQALRRDRWRCVVCGIGIGGKGEAHVGHVEPITTHPHLALTLSNLRSRCAACDA
jgi:5-methylcytosine-specific restriction enzyme A